MTDLVEIQTGKISLSDLTPKVTKSLTGTFLVGLFYERRGLLYCYSIPGNERGWCKSPIEAIELWQKRNADDNREVINPYLL